MIFKLFDLSESEKNVKGKKDEYLLNDINTPILKCDTIYVINICKKEFNMNC
jgi:hypothetical protein